MHCLVITTETTCRIYNNIEQINVKQLVAKSSNKTTYTCHRRTKNVDIHYFPQMSFVTGMFHCKEAVMGTVLKPLPLFSTWRYKSSLHTQQHSHFCTKAKHITRIYSLSNNNLIDTAIKNKCQIIYYPTTTIRKIWPSTLKRICGVIFLEHINRVHENTYLKCSNAYLLYSWYWWCTATLCNIIQSHWRMLDIWSIMVPKRLQLKHILLYIDTALGAYKWRGITPNAVTKWNINSQKSGTSIIYFLT